VDDVIALRAGEWLVTAVEPIMRACAGMWIAHGSGSADQETVDRHDRIAVPPGSPAYQLRRVWLSSEEERGYYYGFANEGLWPLCHVAHVRPVFRSSDWEQYVKVNRKFARTLIDEATSADPIVLVQDYHGLLPRMIRERCPRRRRTFWHIPWLNPEAFSICPWRAELLDGPGAHSDSEQSHCNNHRHRGPAARGACRPQSPDVSYRGQLTAVKRYQIIEWPPPPELTATPSSGAASTCDNARRPAEKLASAWIASTTPRVLKNASRRQRCWSYSEWIGRFTFCRSPRPRSIEQYLTTDARPNGARINDRFAGAAYPPIVLKVEHHDAEQPTNITGHRSSLRQQPPRRDESRVRRRICGVA
jgi:trehalose 6-phosphate synthase